MTATMTDRQGAAAIRDWARRMRWREHRRLRWKARVALERALLPLRAAAAARRAVREFGAGVTAGYGISAGRQWRELYAMHLRYGLGAESYYRFQLFRPERRRRAAQYVDGRQYEFVLRQYCRRVAPGSRAIFVDKRKFELWCAEHGLPSVRTVLELAAGAPLGPAELDAAAAGLPAADLFSKPADLAGGRGVARWEYTGDGYRGADGAVLDARAFVAAVARQGAELRHPMLVQTRLRNHAGLAALTAGGLCTARMVTVRSPGGEPRITFAVQRMPVGDTPADNFDAGGLAAAIDVRTGRLGVAMRKDTKALAAEVATHPTTGAPIAGHQLPCWAEAVALVERAHALVGPAVPIVGWDVAITDRGPAFVEANNVPGINLMQMPSDVPLGETALVSCLLQHLEASA